METRRLTTTTEVLGLSEDSVIPVSMVHYDTGAFYCFYSSNNYDK